MDIIRYENWKWGAFGYCPACGAIGFEDSASMESDIAWFRCSREGCKTNYPKTDITTGKPVGLMCSDGIVFPLRIHSQTTWIEKKPKWWIEAQALEPYSWNWSRFSQACCLSHGLV